MSQSHGSSDAQYSFIRGGSSLVCPETEKVFLFLVENASSSLNMRSNTTNKTVVKLVTSFMWTEAT